MDEASPNSSEVSQPVPKIGIVHHYIRGAFILVGLGVLVLAIWGTQRWSSAKNANVPGFDEFRAVYAEKCGVPAYVEEQPDVVNRAYNSSPALQKKMAEQVVAMKAGNTYCDVVAAELKKVDFVVPKPGL
jgi:hypothetical protein